MITRIHVNAIRVRHNPNRKPVFVATDSKRQRKGNRVEIDGPSALIYRPDRPFTRSGYDAVAWIETRAKVRVYK
jgi:hypothetical protein